MSDLKPVALFCSDLDGTLLGDPGASLEFRRRWESLGDRRPILVYSSGRLVDDSRQVIRAAGLPDPDYYIGGVGTMMHDEKMGEAVAGFAEVLDTGWDRGRAVDVVRSFAGIEEQPAAEQHPWKSSWFWNGASESDLGRLREALRRAGVEAQVIFSSNRDLDVLPAAANKGNALVWLCRQLGVATTEVVVAGDTGNDVSMFLVPGVRAIAPANAAGELIEAAGDAEIHRAATECAAGVIEGLARYGLFPSETQDTRR